MLVLWVYDINLSMVCKIPIINIVDKCIYRIYSMI